MSALTVSDKLIIAEICEYLVTIAIEKKGLYGGGIDLQLPTKIFNIRTTIEYLYNQDPTDDSLIATTNYLYGMCMFNLEALNIMGSSGGVIAPVVGNNAPLPLQFIVAASGTTFVDGQSSVTLTNFIGYNLLFSRNGIPQSTVAGQPSLYSWNRSTGLMTISPAAILDELFQIYPV